MKQILLLYLVLPLLYLSYLLLKKTIYRQANNNNRRYKTSTMKYKFVEYYNELLICTLHHHQSSYPAVPCTYLLRGSK